MAAASSAPGVAVAVAVGVGVAAGARPSPVPGTSSWAGSPGTSWTVDGGTAAAGEGEDEQGDGYGEPRREAHATSSQRGSAAIRRPHVGQSFRSFWAGWSHQLQNRSVSTAHGRLDFDGWQGEDLPHHFELLARVVVGVDLAGLGFDEQLAARGRGAQAVQLALGHPREP